MDMVWHDWWLRFLIKIDTKYLTRKVNDDNNKEVRVSLR